MLLASLRPLRHFTTRPTKKGTNMKQESKSKSNYTYKNEYYCSEVYTRPIGSGPNGLYISIPRPDLIHIHGSVLHCQKCYQLLMVCIDRNCEKCDQFFVIPNPTINCLNAGDRCLKALNNFSANPIIF